MDNGGKPNEYETQGTSGLEKGCRRRRDAKHARNHAQICSTLAKDPFQHDEAYQQDTDIDGQPTIHPQNVGVHHRGWIYCRHDDGFPLDDVHRCHVLSAEFEERTDGSPRQRQIENREAEDDRGCREHYAFIDSFQREVKRQGDGHKQKVRKNVKADDRCPARRVFSQVFKPSFGAVRRHSPEGSEYRNDHKIHYGKGNRRYAADAVQPSSVRVNCELRFFVHFISPFLTMLMTYLACRVQCD